MTLCAWPDRPPSLTCLDVDPDTLWKTVLDELPALSTTLQVATQQT
jgi:hypothetical protein